jgi:hypothetical protein
MNRDHKMNKAVEVLRERLQQLEAEYERDRAELEQAITNLESVPEKTGHAPSKKPAIAPGRWKGMGITDSVHAYLAQCKSGAVPFTTVMEALQVGGVELGDPSKPARFPANVKTTIVNNRRRFRYDRRRDTVELRAAV